ncbi:helix-turn-helix transcriptional regulator [Proteinivorax tanatarense]|uniref:Helix-turn-helix transcriptional regulator n=1 Tax=Proteinivorax tanatarense TaxID=1260629 RepID=A0AAU7VKT3_9FIRM
MPYELLLFGEKVRELREQQKLTQCEVSDLSGVNVETVKRLEQGKVTPKLDTLESLSPILKYDLSKLLAEFRVKDFSKYSQTKQKVELMFDRNDLDGLELEMENLQRLLDDVKNDFFKKEIIQLLLLAKGVLLYKKDKKYNKGLKALCDAMKVFTPSFVLKDYKLCHYSQLEIRILMNIGLVLHKLKRQQKYENLMKFCFEKVDETNSMYPQICHNSAGVYRRKKDYTKALHYSQLGIDYCIETKNLQGISFLYFGKGVAQYYLGIEDYKEAFEKAVFFCKFFGERNLEKSMTENCYKYFGVKLQ